MSVRSSPELKQRVLDLLNQGEEVRDIAEATGLPRSTIYTWRNSMKADSRAHDPKLKEKAIELRHNLMPVKLIKEQLGVPCSTIYEWLSARPKELRFRPTSEPTPRHYDPSLKRRVYELKVEGVKAKDISVQLGLPVQTVYHWLAQARTRATVLVRNLSTELAELAEAPINEKTLPATLARLSRHAKSALRGMSM